MQPCSASQESSGRRRSTIALTGLDLLLRWCPRVTSSPSKPPVAYLLVRVSSEAPRLQVRRTDGQQIHRDRQREKKRGQETRRSFSPSLNFLLSLPHLPLRSLFEGFPIVSVLWTNGFPTAFPTSLSDGCKQLWGTPDLASPGVLRYCRRPGSKAGQHQKGSNANSTPALQLDLPPHDLSTRLSIADSLFFFVACSFERFGPGDGFPTEPDKTQHPFSTFLGPPGLYRRASCTPCPRLAR